MELVIQPYDWTILDCPYREHTIIRCWGLTRDSEPCLVSITDFKPFFQIELPLYVQGRRIKWDNGIAAQVYAKLKERLKEDAPTSCSLRFLNKLYYYHHDRTYPMLLVFFSTERAMNHCINLLSRGLIVDSIDPNPLTLKCWETNIPTIRKLLSVKGANHSQWFQVTAKPSPDKETNLDKEYVCSWRELNPLDSSVTAGWTTYPKVMVIDIETYSANHNAFPNKYKVTDVAYMISVVCQRYQRPETRSKHLIVIGDIPPFDDVEVINTKDEIQLCQALADLVNRLDPDIITGYNIFSFDYDYLDTRLRRLNENWACMGRINGARTWLKSKSWESSAYGVQSLNILMMEGRISVDMYPIILRDYKLPKYDLDTVSRTFLGEGKHDVKATRMFEIYHRYQQTNDPTEMLEVSRYCIQDSVLVIKLMEQLNIWVSLIELSNVVAVPIIDLFTRGQQIRFLCQLYTEASRRGIVLDSRPGKSENFSGGFVYEPEPGLYDYVICLDFSSLYPSIIRAFNICFTTLVPDEVSIPDDQCHILSWEDEGITYRYRFVKQPKGLLPQMCDNLVTERSRIRKQIQGPLQDSGGHPRDDLTPEQRIVYLVAEKRQLALKVSANSIFGALGASNGYLPLIEGARSICAVGRQLILQANEYLQRTYQGRIIYNDTDSTMVKLPFIQSNREAIEWGYKLQDEISGLYPPPLRMEFEKAGRMMPICKKRYSYWLIDRDTFEMKLDKNGDPLLMNKGVILVRRDTCKWQQMVYEKVLKMIMKGTHYFTVLDFINEQILALVRGEVHYSKLSIIRTLGASYRNENYFMNVFGQELAQAGRPIEPGTRLEYVICGDETQPLGKKMRLVEDYVDSRQTDHPDRIDTFYYIEHMIMNPIHQLLEVGYKQEISQLEAFYQEMGYYRILTKLAEMGHGQQVNEALEGRSYHEAVEILKQTRGLKTKVTKLCTTYLGRKAIKSRNAKEPIKTQLKWLLLKRAVTDQLKNYLAR